MSTYKTVKYTAVHDNNEGGITIALMECLKNDQVDSADKFFKQLKKAVTAWTDKNPTGRKYLVENNMYFDFADLAMYSENPELLNALAAHGILFFKMEVLDNKNFHFPYFKSIIDL